MTASKTAEQPVRGAKQAQLQEIEEATIRLCGDSGDGMQLAGTQFTNTSAILGNDISTLPDFPAEIRATAGTLAGEWKLASRRSVTILAMGVFILIVATITTAVSTR